MAITNAGIVNETENKLLKRKELLISLEFDGPTPSREEIKRALFDKFNLKQENMVIVRAVQEFGDRHGSVLVHEYTDKEAMKIAQKHMLSRPNAKKGGEAPAQSTAKAEAPKEEAKAEKKEEAKPEEKKQGKGEKKEEAKPAEGEKK